MVVLEYVFIILIIFIFLIYKISTWRFDYWLKRNIKHINPIPIFGNYASYILQVKYSGQVNQSLCEKFPDEPYFGTFYGTEPALVIKDPEMMKAILVKDFYYFNGREISQYTHNEVITRNLFFTFGDRWKLIRQKLTPMLSSAKLRAMFHMIGNCNLKFEDMIDHEYSISNIIEARSLVLRYTMDSIVSCSFGIEANTMAKNSEDNKFRVMGDLIFGKSYYRGIKTASRAIWPRIFYGLGLKSFPVEIDTFFKTVIFEVFKQRNYKPSPRNDFVDQVLNIMNDKFVIGECLSNSKTGECKLSKLVIDDDFLAAACVTVFAAGFETSAGTASYILYELAKNQEAQRKAQEDVDNFLQRHNNQVKYDCVSELSYVEACMYEALRLYPVIGLLTREVMEDYTFDNGLKVEKGLRIHLPVFHMQRDPKNFPNPDEYRPERFLPGEKDEIKPYTYTPFGDGHRICIGMRFAKMQILAGMVTVLKKYSVELADDMPRTMEFEPTTLLLAPAYKIKLKFVPRNDWEQRTYVR